MVEFRRFSTRSELNVDGSLRDVTFGDLLAFPVCGILLDFRERKMANGKIVIAFVTVAALSLELCSSEQEGALRGPPVVETKPNLLDYFLPAAMQIMAHLTEHMKFDLKPQSNRPTPSTTTTLRPTPAHPPAIVAPMQPLGPQAYFSKDISFEEYLHRVQNPPENYFDRYHIGEGRSIKGFSSESNTSRIYSNVYGNLPRDLDKYISQRVIDVHNLVNRIDDDFIIEDIHRQVEEFNKEYDDDSDFRNLLVKQKRMPPVKAYVTLLSLYDLLNKESKKLGLNKYGGFTDNVLSQLAMASQGTSSYQLRFVLKKIVEKRETKQRSVIMKIQTLVADLEKEGSYINVALEHIPPLPFAL